MAARVQPVNLTDFNGGLNMRSDAFGLADNESPDMLNVDIDPRGGFVARRGWSRWNSSDVHATWNPRTLFVHELSDGTDRVWLANNSKISHSTTGAFTVQQSAGTDVVADADPHGADFAPWGDSLYVACGRSNQAVVVNSALSATRLTAAGAGQWTAYATPSTTVMPKADYIAAHLGYIFVASTVEDGTTYRNRVRWSHFNVPGAWLETDLIDFNEGGGPITGLVPMSDHLLVFKQSAVWAIYGYESENWQVVNVSRDVGAVTRQAIATSEGAAFFYSHLEGIYVIADGKTPQEVSLPLRPMFDNGGFNGSAQDSVWLGWVGQRLYFSCPYDELTSPTDAKTTFVFDPSISGGAWMRHQGANGYGIGPFAQGGFGGGAGLRLACARVDQDIMRLEADDLPVDDFGGVDAGFSSYFVTKWVDGGWPTLKKSWRRPDLVVKERDQAYNITIEAYRDYDEANVSRTKVVPVAAGGTGATWGAFTWGDGTLYGPPAKGSVIERGGSFGAARSIQLKVSGEQSKPWGVDAIVMKFIPRRLR